MPNANVRSRVVAGSWYGEQGARNREVDEVFGVDHTVFIRAWERFQQHGTPVRRRGCGRTRVTFEAEDRFLVIQAGRNRFAAATQLRSYLKNASGVRVSTQTI
jgi:transposase